MKTEPAPYLFEYCNLNWLFSPAVLDQLKFYEGATVNELRQVSQNILDTHEIIDGTITHTFNDLPMKITIKDRWLSVDL